MTAAFMLAILSFLGGLLLIKSGDIEFAKYSATEKFLSATAVWDGF